MLPLGSWFLVLFFFTKKKKNALVLSAQTGGVPHQIPVTVANLGDNLTLTCPISGDRAGLFYWYKLKFGHMFQVVAKGTHGKLSLQEEFNSPRFTVKKGDAVYFLNITDVHKEDEGTYFCQAGSVYEFKFTNGTVLAVRGKAQLGFLFFALLL